MEIKRNFEKLVVVKRRFIISQNSSEQQIVCAECGEMMLTIAQTAAFLRIKQRRIFQLAETGSLHFTEAETGEFMICLSSLSAELDKEKDES